MRKIQLFQSLFLGVIIFITACQPAAQSLSTKAVFKPGDTISGMSLATGAADAHPLWAFCSASPENTHIKTFNCHAPVLATLAIGHVFLFADEALISSNWSEFVWDLALDDQAVDLTSFGTFEYVMPSMSDSPSPVREVFQKVTAWNIVLTNLNPGDHVLHFRAHNDTQSYSWLINLTVEPAEGIDVSSVPFPLHS